MPRVIRIITYDFDSSEGLSRQLAQGLSDGDHNFGPGRWISIETLNPRQQANVAMATDPKAKEEKRQ